MTGYNKGNTIFYAFRAAAVRNNRNGFFAANFNTGITFSAF